MSPGISHSVFGFGCYIFPLLDVLVRKDRGYLGDCLLSQTKIQEESCHLLFSEIDRGRRKSARTRSHWVGDLPPPPPHCLSPGFLQAEPFSFHPCACICFFFSQEPERPAGKTSGRHAGISNDGARLQLSPTSAEVALLWSQDRHPTKRPHRCSDLGPIEKPRH